METNKTTVSEYKIGNTTYLVRTILNSVSQESISDILKRLIIRECEKMPGETGQEPEKQVV